MSDDLTVERQSGVATITINRPAGYNAMKAAMWSQMDAQTALELGLVNWVVPDAELEPQTAQLAARLADSPPVAVARTKATLNRSFQNSLSEHFQDEVLDVGLCVAQPDFARRVRAFMERKR